MATDNAKGWADEATATLQDNANQWSTWEQKRTQRIFQKQQFQLLASVPFTREWFGSSCAVVQPLSDPADLVLWACSSGQCCVATHQTCQILHMSTVRVAAAGAATGTPIITRVSALCQALDLHYILLTHHNSLKGQFYAPHLQMRKLSLAPCIYFLGHMASKWQSKISTQFPLVSKLLSILTSAT